MLPGRRSITDDGATIAREITLQDPSENLGAQLIREVAKKTQEAAGDGTTTACVLAQCIAREGLRVVAAGAQPDARQASEWSAPSMRWSPS